MGAVSAIDWPQSEELKQLYQRLEEAASGLGVLNVFKVMAHNPGLLRSWLRMASMLLNGLALSPRLRELAILRVFQRTGAEYGFAHHIRIAKDVGIRDDEIAALRDYEHNDLFSELDRRVLRYTDLVTSLDDDASMLARSLREALSERELLELTFCIAHWNMLARVLIPLEVALDESLVQALPAHWRAWM
jgi:4-carboxymuconolactone decarboxylase